ncbi:uncharacterized protein LOC115363064 [Myripristis murdjan]|uniref:uncharacterized protein LOC115363064 n=1 Tax=Myripristis murdjan TaxID=586833 RepID=UPI001175CE03|nr:uncharacterized protein LOC115363064 [Myripristis murdjan]
MEEDMETESFSLLIGDSDEHQDQDENIIDRFTDEADTPMDINPASESASSTGEKLVPELTVVVIGDTNSVQPGSRNLLLAPDDQAAAVDDCIHFSSKLYDLCGRHISVINLLGLQNAEQLEQGSLLSRIDQIVHEQGIHAFLLLIPNGQHVSHYTSGVQRLEQIFGKGSLAFAITVVTHDSDEKCDSALTDLKANSEFDEKRYHTCSKHMSDETEIIALIEKIDVMVSDNEPNHYRGAVCTKNKEQQPIMDQKTSEEERTSDSVVQQTAESDEEKDELEDEAETKNKCEPVSEPDGVISSETNETAEQHNKTIIRDSEIKSVDTSAANEKGIDCVITWMLFNVI